MRAFPKPTERIHLGASSLWVSPFCLGWVEDPDTVLAAFDIGINFFFLPSDYHLPLYRHTIEGIQRLLARGTDMRDRIVVAGVGYIENPAFFSGTLQELLWAVPELGRLDVGLAGAVTSASESRIAQLDAMRKDGELDVAAIGASFHSRSCARTAIERAALDIAFIRYNPLHPGAREDVFPFVGEHRAVTLFNFVNAAGYVDDASWRRLGLSSALWHPQLHDYYRFALTRPEIDGLLVAPKVPAHVERILRAVEAGPLSAEEEEHLIDLALLQVGLATLRDT
jgi:aryl-alcohol dehydrogenase-like predicted oxidoreductase